MVLGFVNDKDLSEIFSILPVEGIYYFTRASVPRSMDHQELLQQAISYGLQGSAHDNVNKAFTAARKAAVPEDMIFVGGSTFVVADLLEIM
jgi:dihydrofolate synthase/folylpolyglutamate synthase